MSASPDPSDVRRHVLERIEALMEHARAGHAPDLAGLVAEFRALDPALQRRVAQVMRQSRGDLSAVRATIEGAPGRAPAPAAGPSRADSARSAQRATAHPPTVVDARGRLPWPVLLAASVAAAIAAGVIASGQ